MYEDLNKIDYDHWCKQVGSTHVKIYKDYVDNGGVKILKSELEPSPVLMEVRVWGFTLARFLIKNMNDKEFKKLFGKKKTKKVKYKFINKKKGIWNIPDNF